MRVRPQLTQRVLVTTPESLEGSAGHGSLRLDSRQVREEATVTEVGQVTLEGIGTEPSSPQVMEPTSRSVAHCSGTSRTVPCRQHSGNSVRRSGAGSG